MNQAQVGVSRCRCPELELAKTTVRQGVKLQIRVRAEDELEKASKRRQSWDQ